MVEVDIGETIKSNIDYWKNLYFKEKEENEKYNIKINNEHKYCDKDDVDFLLNLIEKQQKEIEDNKKYINLHYVPYEQYTSKLNELNKKWQDKIKAKIEELNKQEQDLQNSISDKEREEYSDANISWVLMDIHIRKEVLQSLLEKE